MYKFGDEEQTGFKSEAVNIVDENTSSERDNVINDAIELFDLIDEAKAAGAITEDQEQRLANVVYTFIENVNNAASDGEILVYEKKLVEDFMKIWPELELEMEKLEAIDFIEN